MNRLRWLTGFVAASLVLPASGRAQGPEVSVAASQSRFTVGDRIHVDVTVVHAPGDSVVWPEITDPMGPFEVAGAEALRPTLEAGRERSVLRLTLTAFELGGLEFPAMPVGVIRSGDGERFDVETDPVTLQVESIGLDEGSDIRDIKPPLAIPRNWLLSVPWLLATLLAGALGYWAYRRYRRRPTAPQPAVPLTPPRPPHEIALEAFARLRASPLLERGEIKQYFTEASEILRRYVEARFRVEAMELPSADILDGLRDTSVSFESLERFREFFRRADLVKFAKQRPAPEVSVQIVTLGEEIVHATPTPTPAEPAEPAEPAVSAASALSAASVEGRGREAVQ